MGIPNGIPCGYCFSRWADSRDHLIPRSYGGKSNPKNLYPACMRCNLLLSNKVFNSTEGKREYVRTELIKRNQWGDLPPLRQEDYKATQEEGVLQRGLSMESLGYQPSKATNQSPSKTGLNRRKNQQRYKSVCQLKTCRRLFPDRSKIRLFCSKPCRDAWNILKIGTCVCGSTVYLPSRFCSLRCEDHSKWQQTRGVKLKIVAERVKA